MLEHHYAFRNLLVDTVVGDAIGPTTPDELIEDAPLDRYISGILYPRSADVVDAWNDVDEEGIETDIEENADPPVALANVRYPSSMGLTFSVARDTGPITVEVDAARYEPA